MNVNEFKAEIKRRGWRTGDVTKPCCLCGGNEWRFANAQVILDDLYVAVSCAACPPRGPLMGPTWLESEPNT